MKAVRFHEYGKYPVVEEVPEPTVSGPLDVLVEVAGAGVCRMDQEVIDGKWAREVVLTPPLTLGHENAGWVREVGSAVTNVVPGDAVILHPLVTCGLCRPCWSGDDVHCENSEFAGFDRPGGMAELLVTHARSVVTLPHTVEPAEVAWLADAGLVAYHAVRKALPLLHPGTCLVVLGTGGLGQVGLQCAMALTPAEVVVVDFSQGVLSKADELGAHHTVTANHQQVEAVRQLTSGRGANVVLDFAVDKGSGEAGIAMLRRAGSYFAIGSTGGLVLPTTEIISAEINVVSKFSGSHNDLEELMILVHEGEIRLDAEHYRIDGIVDALRDLDNDRVRGWPVLVPTAA